MTNQGTEVQCGHTCKQKDGCVPDNEKCFMDTPSLTRGGSLDSAISSSSSKKSAHGTLPLMNRSVCTTLESVGTLTPGYRETVEGLNGNVNHDTQRWVHNLSSERAQTAIPFIRTSTATKRSLSWQTGSRSAESSNKAHECIMKEASMSYANSEAASELTIHLYIIVFCALSSLRRIMLEVSYKHHLFIQKGFHGREISFFPLCILFSFTLALAVSLVVPF